MIGATTVGEYRKYVEKDPALARRFQQVLVEEPSVEDTIAILRGIKERYELHHGIRITDNAVIAAAKSPKPPPNAPAFALAVLAFTNVVREWHILFWPS